VESRRVESSITFCLVTGRRGGEAAGSRESKVEGKMTALALNSLTSRLLDSE
jgi:hypothetical protein